MCVRYENWPRRSFVMRTKPKLLLFNLVYPRRSVTCAGVYTGLYDILGGITSPWGRTPWVVPLSCTRNVFLMSLIR